MKVTKGREMDRIIGWDRGEWQRFTGIHDLGQTLPEQRPGCGARNVAPDVAEELTQRYSKTAFDVGRSMFDVHLSKQPCPAYGYRARHP